MTVALRSYRADGSGRDWFFVGDAAMRQGLHTPSLHEQQQRDPPRGYLPKEKRLVKRVGLPAEMQSEKRRLASTSGNTVAKWQRHHSSPCFLDGLKPELGTTSVRAVGFEAEGSPIYTPKLTTSYMAMCETIPPAQGHHSRQKKAASRKVSFAVAANEDAILSRAGSVASAQHKQYDWSAVWKDRYGKCGSIAEGPHDGKRGQQSVKLGFIGAGEQESAVARADACHKSSLTSTYRDMFSTKNYWKFKTADVLDRSSSLPRL